MSSKEIKIGQLTTASSLSPSDIVVVFQNGVAKKLPLSYLYVSGQAGRDGASGFSGFSGFSGLNGEYAASGFSGFSGISGFSGVSGFSGASAFVKIDPTHVLFSNEKGVVVGSPNVTTDGNTITLSSAGVPQLVVKDKDKSIQVHVDGSNGFVAFHSQPYSSTFFGMGMPDGVQGVDFVVSASTYGKGCKEILRIVNEELNLKMSRKVTIAKSDEEQAGLNIPVGIKPGDVRDGDVWREEDGLYVQVGEKSIGPLSAMSNITPWKKVQAEITADGHPRILGECSFCDFFYRRVGDSMECRIDIRQTKSVDSFGGEYLIVIPSNLNLDEEKMNLMPHNSLMSIGSGTMFDFAPNDISFQPRSSRHVGVLVNRANWTSGNHSLNNNTFNLSGEFTIPIKEWR